MTWWSSRRQGSSCRSAAPPPPLPVIMFAPACLRWIAPSPCLEHRPQWERRVPRTARSGTGFSARAKEIAARRSPGSLTVRDHRTRRCGGHSGVLFAILHHCLVFPRPCDMSASNSAATPKADGSSAWFFDKKPPSVTPKHGDNSAVWYGRGLSPALHITPCRSSACDGA